MNKEINDLKQQIMWLQNQNAFLTNKQEALRDHFAGMAMQGLLASPVMGDCALHNSSADWLKDITKCSYDFADFMMVYREKKDV